MVYLPIKYTDANIGAYLQKKLFVLNLSQRDKCCYLHHQKNKIVRFFFPKQISDSRYKKRSLKKLQIKKKINNTSWYNPWKHNGMKIYFHFSESIKFLQDF